MLPRTETRERLLSLDAFRGATVAAMILVNNPGSWEHVYAPLQHAEWHGCTPTDLVFPFFLFIAGVALVLATARRLERGATRAELLLDAVGRGVTLFALGLVLGMRSAAALPVCLAFAGAIAASWFAGRLGRRRALVSLLVWLAFAAALIAFDWVRRIPGVLQRIGLCYVLASALHLCTPRRARLWLLAALLLGYWALLTLVPVPGIGAGHIDSKSDNLAAWLDRQSLGTRVWIPGERDPEGPLSTLGALATIWFGMAAGDVLRRLANAEQRATELFVRGAVLTALGYAWSWVLPLNKPLWTSSYAVFTAGLATTALAQCVWFVDARGWRRAAAPCATYGLNAIVVFVGSGLAARGLAAIDVEPGVSAKSWLYARVLAPVLPPLDASLVYAVLWVGAWYVVLRSMQARGVVIRV